MRPLYGKGKLKFIADFQGKVIDHLMSNALFCSPYVAIFG